MTKPTSGELNKNQKTAASHKDGPLLVVAGAGTGKTKVIVERILKLIDDGVEPESILALTFTEKAANEMLDRVNEARGGYTLDVNISTFNTFGSRLLRQHASDIGISENVRLLGETGQLVFLREHLDSLGLDYFSPVSSPDSQLSTLSSHFSKLKQQLVTPDEYKKFASKMPTTTEEDALEAKKTKELADTYEKYIHLCRQQSVIDYDDQIYLVVEMLKKRPNVRNSLKNQFKYILVDEFQDTNPMQSELLDLLANDKQNLMVVGDDDQSIYAWRGATLKNILDFTNRYPKAEQVTLIENYRNTQPILDSAYDLIQHNNPERLEVMNELDKKLVANVKGSGQPELKRFASLSMELNWLANDIKARLDKGASLGSIAVLTRRNAGAERVHEALDVAGVEHIVAGVNRDLYQQPAVAGLVEVLKAVNDKRDNVALYHALGGPFFEIEPQLLADSGAEARSSNKQLWNVLNKLDSRKLKSALNLIMDIGEKSNEMTVRQIAYEILDKTGVKDGLYEAAEIDEVAALQVQALGQYFETLKEFERAADVPSLFSYIDNLEVLKASGNDFEDYSMQISDSTVNVLSVHKAKGLEWDTVYIIDCTEGSFPLKSFGSSLDVPEELKVHSEADDRMAEERRLMYVAATRAKRNLILSYSDTHTHTTKRYPSRFLKELLPDEFDALEKKKIQGQLSELEYLSQDKPAGEVTIPSKMINGDKIVLNVSQVDKFLYCPRDFYYRYILNVPQPLEPTLQYGTLIHSYIQRLNEGLKASDIPKLDSLLDDAKKNLPKNGYLSAKQRDRAHAQGLKTIEAIYKRFVDEKNVPTEIEQSFRVTIPGTDLILTGRMDAVFESASGVEIRDYKTGTTVNDDAKAKRRAQSSVQLSLYAIAWRVLNDEMPESLVLDFVETNRQGSVRKQPKSLDSLEKKLGDIPKAIRVGEYKPGRDHTYCSHPI